MSSPVSDRGPSLNNRTSDPTQVLPRSLHDCFIGPKPLLERGTKVVAQTSKYLTSVACTAEKLMKGVELGVRLGMSDSVTSMTVF